MAPTQLRVRPTLEPLRGSVPVASDPDILERALLFAAISNGPCRFDLPRPPASWERCVEALRALGVSTQSLGQGQWQIAGIGLFGFTSPASAIDVGGAPVLARGLLGCLAAQRFASELRPFESPELLASEAAALNARGARVTVAGQSCRLDPIERPLARQHIALATPSPLLKHLLLVSGLYADGPTLVSEPLLSVDHSERLLDALGVDIESAGPIVRLSPPASSGLSPFEFIAPGSPTACAYLIAAATSVPGSHITVRDVALNATRTGFLDTMKAFGGRVGLTPKRQALNELAGDVSIMEQPLTGAKVGGELCLRLEVELPAMAAVAAHAFRESHFLDLAQIMPAQEITKLVGMLRSFGVQAECVQDGFRLQGRGGRPLGANRVTTGGDPRLAALAVLLALGADGESVIDDVDCLAEFLPRFVGTLRALGASIEVLR
jgi:3-phosphoshikimate 1-carboxyvinyltransferase